MSERQSGRPFLSVEKLPRLFRRRDHSRLRTMARFRCLMFITDAYKPSQGIWTRIGPKRVPELEHETRRHSFCRTSLRSHVRASRQINPPNTAVKGTLQESLLTHTDTSLKYVNIRFLINGKCSVKLFPTFVRKGHHDIP